jgi:NTP pyrophosphatase (non-canonical NTP hydrolase)
MTAPSVIIHMKHSTRTSNPEALSSCEAKLSRARIANNMLSDLCRTNDMPAKVAEFHDLFGHPVDSRDSHGEGEEDLAFRKLSISLIKEEARELLEAMGDMNSGDGTPHEKEQILKEMCDVLVVVIGRAIGWGWDITTAFDRVMQSQKSKLGADGKPIYREDGKIIKGPNYREPDLSGLCDS